jgi:hypothetical protein
VKRFAIVLFLLGVGGALCTGCRGETSSGLSSFVQRMIGGDENRHAAMIADPNDPDRRRRGIQHCSTRRWGQTERFLEVYAMVLRKDSDATVRAEAAAALGRAGNDAYLPNLVTALKSDPAEGVRWAAASALDELRGPRAAPALRDKALDDPSPDVRAAAARALRHYRDPQTLRTLVAALDDSEFTVRHEARNSLIKLTGRVRGYDPQEWSDVATGRAGVAPASGRPWWDWMGVTDDESGR